MLQSPGSLPATIGPNYHQPHHLPAHHRFLKSKWHRRLSSNSSSFCPLRALPPTRETDVRLFCRPIALVCVPSKGTRQRKLCAALG